MNNKDYILEKAFDLFGAESIGEILGSQLDIPIHTKTYWEKKGFKVKENEKPIKIKQWFKTAEGYKTKYIDFYIPAQIEPRE